MVSVFFNDAILNIYDGLAASNAFLNTMQTCSFSEFSRFASSFIICLVQKGLGDKMLNQLEKSVNSKLESAMARQIQTQFQTSGKQALQVSVKTTLEHGMA